MIVKSNRTPRRPARLFPQVAENVVGESDPAEQSEFAHATAWALLGVVNGRFDRETICRIQETCRLDGLDLVAETWSKSPAFTLPGSLWRLYLLRQWQQINPTLVEQRYLDGVEVLQADAEFVDPYSLEAELAQNPPSLTEILRQIDFVFNGYADREFLESVLRGSAKLLRVLAAGVGHSAAWITRVDDPLAFPVTLRARSLLVTADELAESARRARAKIWE